METYAQHALGLYKEQFEQRGLTLVVYGDDAYHCETIMVLKDNARLYESASGSGVGMTLAAFLRGYDAGQKHTSPSLLARIFKTKRSA